MGKTPIRPADIYITATTNKAVEVLQQNLGSLSVNTETIFSTFKTIVRHNLETGEDYLVGTNSSFVLENSLVFIDECSMLPQQMKRIIDNHSKNCKFVYIGDSYQLAPVNERPHWDNTPSLTTARLYTPVRNQGKKALIDLCSQLRRTVETLTFEPINLVDGVIDHLDDTEAETWINQTDYEKNRILSYTNCKALKYIDFIEQHKGNLQKIRPNQIYINNSHFISDMSGKFYPEELIKIIGIHPNVVSVSAPGSTQVLHVYKAEIVSIPNPTKRSIAYIPLNVSDYLVLLRLLAREQNWPAYYWFKENILDLRLPYACTVHKSQGNTYEEVLVDCGSFRTCNDPTVAARLLYVAVSRAQKRVLFYGKLPKKYGGFIC